MLDYVYARGGCDLAAVTHYFKMVADEVYGEFNTVEKWPQPAAAPLGVRPPHVKRHRACRPPAVRRAWL